MSGVSWKVWKIKRQWRVVETRWGPIKVVNRRIVHAKVLPHKKWPAFATIESAKEFYEARIKEKLRGLRLYAAQTQISDFAMICADCHRMMHRGNPWPTVEELKLKLLVRGEMGRTANGSC